VARNWISEIDTWAVDAVNAFGRLWGLKYVCLRIDVLRVDSLPYALMTRTLIQVTKSSIMDRV
jgi:hypothetical protein